MFYLEKPLIGKAQEPTDFEISLYYRGYKDEDLKGNDLEISLRQRAVTKEYRSVSLSLSLSVVLYTTVTTTSTLTKGLP